MKNVVQIEKFMGQRNDSGVRPYAGVLAECRRLLAERLGRALAGAMEELDAELQSRRLKAAGAGAEDVLVEAQFQLRSLGISVNRRFHEVYEREFQHRVAPEQATEDFYGTASQIFMEISIADDDQIADELLIQQQAKQLDQACEAELKELRVRVAHMLGETSLKDKRDPIGPSAVSSALKEIVWQLDSPRPAKVLLLDLFHNALLVPLPALYKEINALLIARKVLPRIRHDVKRDRPRASARHSVPPGEAPFDETATSGIIHRLFHGEAGDGGGGGGGSGGGYFGAASRAQAAARNADAVQALTRLQRGEVGVALGQDNFELAVEKCATDNVLHGLIEAGIGRHLGTVDAIIIDVVAALFDYVFEDPHVPGVVKGLIGRLQIPVLKLAMMDHSFFANRGHPARRLVNILSQSAAAWDGDITVESPLYLRAEPLVSRIQNTFGDNPEVFTAALADLEAFLAEQESKGEAQAAAMTSELEQQERQDVARMTAGNATAAYLANPALPEAVATFLSDTWQGVLMEAALADSGGDAEWLAAVTTMENLVWSVLPLRSAEDRQRLVKLLPSLLGGLRSGLEKIGAEDSLRDAFFADLMRLHAAAVKAGMAAGAAASAPAAMPVTPPPAKLEPPSTAVELEALSRGSWISTRDDQGKVRRMRLSWISPARTMYLFANHEGERAVALSATELSARFARGDAILGDDDLPLLDRVVDQVLDDFEAWR